MPRTPDRIEAFLVFNDTAADPAGVGEITRNGTDFKMRDGLGVFNPRGGGGISEAQHELIDSLVHELAETMYTEITRSGGQVSDVVTWQTAAKLLRVRDVTITRSGGQVSVVVERQYNAAGALVQTLTHTITRSSGQAASIATVET